MPATLFQKPTAGTRKVFPSRGLLPVGSGLPKIDFRITSPSG
jgi:hypothetical protein